MLIIDDISSRCCELRVAGVQSSNPIPNPELDHHMHY